MPLNDNTVNSFIEIDIEKLKRIDLGPFKFENEANLLEPVYNMLKEMVNICSNNSNIEDIIFKKVNDLINEFNEICKRIITFEVNVKDVTINTKKDKISSQIINYVNKIFQGSTFLGPGNALENPNNLLLYYNTLNNYNIKDSKKTQDEIDEILKKANIANNTLEGYIVDVQNELGKVTVQKYANIFKDQSIEHKTASKRWLIFGISLTIILILTVLLIRYIFPISDDIGDLKSYTINNLFSKISILFILVFLTTYSFKQFSINKHLYTINKHRQNTLNSYNLFIDSIQGDDKQQISNLLMLEVARAIYEQSKTGYLTDKGGEIESPSSIIELTKLISNTTKAT